MFYERHLTVPTIEKTVYLHPDSSISTNAVFASGISRFLLSREWCICIRTRPYPSSFARSICRFLASMKHCNPALPKFRTWRVIKNTWLVICSGTSAFKKIIVFFNFIMRIYKYVFEKTFSEKKSEKKSWKKSEKSNMLKRPKMRFLNFRYIPPPGVRGGVWKNRVFCFFHKIFRFLPLCVYWNCQFQTLVPKL